MRKSLRIGRNILIVSFMLWCALSYQDRHRFDQPKTHVTRPMS
jgi:hypothetical protein